MQGVELHQVVADSDQIPFVRCLLQPAEQDELSLTGVDLTLHGLHDRFAPRVGCSEFLRLQFPGHPLLELHIGRDTAPVNIGITFAVLHPAGRDEELGLVIAGRFNGLGVVQIRC